MFIVLSPQRPDGADVDGAAVAAVSTAAVRGRGWWGSGKACGVGEVPGRAATAGPRWTSMAQRVAAAAGAAPRPVAAEAPHADALLPLPAPLAPQRATPAVSPAAFTFTQTSTVNLSR